MRELDVILNQFLDREGEALSAEELHSYSELLETQDPELYSWMLGKAAPDRPDWINLVARIRAS